MSRRSGFREKLVSRRGKLRQATFKFVTVAWPILEHATEWRKKMEVKTGKENAELKRWENDVEI